MKKTVYTPGVWDILHTGHINILTRAKLCGDYLVVGICSDRLARLYGKNPTMNEYERAKIVTALRVVDEVHIYDDVDQTAAIKMFNVGVFAVGEQFGYQGVAEHQQALCYCNQNNIPVIRLFRSPGVSSSSIKEFWQNRAKKLSDGEVGLYQATSLTKTEDLAQERKDKDWKYILEAINIGHVPKNAALELGCGVGRITFELAKIYNYVYANDYVREFIDIANAKAVEQIESNIEFMCEEAHKFYKQQYDCCFIAGLFICLTDEQLDKVLNKISYIENVIIKESVATSERFILKDHYSEELQSKYEGIYRTQQEIVDLFVSHGYKLSWTDLVEEHRKETHLRVFLFKKS